MKVLIVEPGKYPREADIEHTLEAEQAVAGGTIEGITGTFTFDEHHNPVKQTAILCFDGATPVLKEMF